MGLPPASVAMAMSQMNHLNTIANMAAAAQQIHTHVHRAPVIKVELSLELNYRQDTEVPKEVPWGIPKKCFYAFPINVSPRTI